MIAKIEYKGHHIIISRQIPWKGKAWLSVAYKNTGNKIHGFNVEGYTQDEVENMAKERIDIIEFLDNL